MSASESIWAPNGLGDTELAGQRAVEAVERDTGDQARGGDPGVAVHGEEDGKQSQPRLASVQALTSVNRIRRARVCAPGATMPGPLPRRATGRRRRPDGRSAPV
jgi:hypothetical protein